MVQIDFRYSCGETSKEQDNGNRSFSLGKIKDLMF